MTYSNHQSQCTIIEIVYNQYADIISNQLASQLKDTESQCTIIEIVYNQYADIISNQLAS